MDHKELNTAWLIKKTDEFTTASSAVPVMFILVVGELRGHHDEYDNTADIDDDGHHSYRLFVQKSLNVNYLIKKNIAKFVLIIIMIMIIMIIIIARTPRTPLLILRIQYGCLTCSWARSIFFK